MSRKTTARIKSRPPTNLVPTTRVSYRLGLDSGSANAPTPKTIETVIQSKIELAQQKSAAAARVNTSSYQLESRRPLVCLLFVMPLIVVYEVVMIFNGDQKFRSGVDQWLDQLLSLFGFGQWILLPLITAGILIAWHHRLNDHWRVRVSVFGGMIIESIGLGLVLFWTASAIHWLTCSFVLPFDLATENYATKSLQLGWSTTMMMIGSGIHEELFFRLILLTSVIHFANRRKRTPWLQSEYAPWIGIVAVSLFFAALHYNFINPAGANFEPASFFFRFGASVIFSVLFLFRGFGIAVGAHVAFDVLTQL